MTVKQSLLICLCASMSYAQLDRGTLTGIVTDPSGALVPRVRITATHLATGVASATIADETGNYTLVSLPIGTYRVECDSELYHVRQSDIARQHAAPNAGHVQSYFLREDL